MSSLKKIKQDAAFLALIQAYENCNKNPKLKILWLFDENLTENTDSLQSNTHCISNRFDVIQTLLQQNHQATFSDFDFSQLTPNSFDAIFYRISKEKSVVHHIINSAKKILRLNGHLILAGLKNEGAKTYLDNAAKTLGCTKCTQKNGPAYWAKLAYKYNNDHTLSDNNYASLRLISPENPTSFNSKPGLFGWQKIDSGSAYLTETLKAIHANNPLSSKRLLDLGCGYGYLSLTLTLEILKKTPKTLVLTDNNAAALIAAKYNCNAHNLNATVIPANAGHGINEEFDMIVCNPPFHQGFAVEGDLTTKFLNAAARVLTTKGVAFFVVNSFIPLHKKAKAHFVACTMLANNGRFSVYQLREPKRPSHH